MTKKIKGPAKFNPNSGDQLSQLLFNILKLEPKEEWRRDKKPAFFSVKEDVLQELLSFTLAKDPKRIIELILQTRGLKKQISTYFDGIEELTYDCDSCIHQQFNHSATDTGRLSCKTPNTQNVPNVQNILEFFTTRF